MKYTCKRKTAYGLVKVDWKLIGHRLSPRYRDVAYHCKQKRNFEINQLSTKNMTMKLSMTIANVPYIFIVPIVKMVQCA